MKNYHLNNFVSTIFVSNYQEFNDKEFFDHLVSLNIFSYFIFQREKKQKEHWQCYFELKERKYFSWLKKKLRNSHIERRTGSQTEAINYCKKRESKIGKLFEWGKPKENSKNNHSMFDKNVFEKTIEDIEKGKFKSFKQIAKKNKSFFWRNRNILKDVWNENNPINQLNVFPARVIWLFGKSGAGKSTWTRKYLFEKKYCDNEIACISPQNMTYSNKIYFDLFHESCKVLVINEVDGNFPKHNNLISFIDRNTLLVTKGSHIRNNFELIIINSLYRPEEIFSFLGKEIASQILRRIFDPLMNCLVLEIQKNEKLLKDIENLNLNREDFQKKYQPISLKISQPNYDFFDF